jgi:hypothetical protein
MVARGVRSTRGLQEALAIEPRTVQYYTQAGEWLGLLESSSDCALTPLGLDYVYAGRRRVQVYARAVWSNPFAAELLAGQEGGLPPVDEIAVAIAALEPDLSPATVRRRASSVRALLLPVEGHPRPSSKGNGGKQLALPLSMAAAVQAPPKIILKGDKEYDPDVYRYLLEALLEYGELSLGHVRALLDRSGAAEAPIGGYVDMAISRGDADRIGEHLVATTGAVERRDLVETTTSVMLSDARYRQYLHDVTLAATDRAAEIRRDEVAHRFLPWDRRLFGRPLEPERLGRDLESVLMDRPLVSFPTATRQGVSLTPVLEPFLDVWEQSGLALCLPPYLNQLQGGIAAVNRSLRIARNGSSVGLPDIATRSQLFHGGVLHPGEPLPRSVPDTRSLRLRLLLHAPYAALMTAVLLLHRQRPELIEVIRMKVGWSIRYRRERLGSVLDVVDDFAAARGWLASRRVGTGLDAEALLGLLETLGIATIGGRRALLHEQFFARLRTEAEEMEVADRLAPLAASLDAHLEAVEPRS